MGRMKELAMDLGSGQNHILGAIEVVATHTRALEEEMARLRKLVSQMVEAGTDREKLVDRLIEMSMVQKGEVDAANTHRRTATPRVESHPQEEDWNPAAMDEWPPDGCDVAELKG